MGCFSSFPVQETTAFHDNYKLSRKIGEGAFGQVRLAKGRSEDTEVAVKILDLRFRTRGGDVLKTYDTERLKIALQEVKHWQMIGSGPHVVELYHSFFERNLFYMVMQRCHCSLMDRLSKSSCMLEGDLCRIFSEMLAGIQHVHECRVVHRDVKPDNFLFGGEDGQTVQLCDYGLAAKLPKKGGLKGVFGTAPYMSPEMLCSKEYSGKTDVWSFGATVFLMIHGDYPYVPAEPSATNMKKCIIQNRPEVRFVRPLDERTSFSRPFVDRATPFLQALLQRTPGTRKTASEAAQLPFLAQVDPVWASEVVGEIPQSEGIEEAETVLAPVFRKARIATLAEKDLARVQPIKLTGLDELLEMLQRREKSASTFFSEGDADLEKTCEKARSMRESQSECRVAATRRPSRFSTHSGCTSGTLYSDHSLETAKNVPNLSVKGGKTSRVSP